MSHKTESNLYAVKVTVPESTTVNQGDFAYLDGWLGLAQQTVENGAGVTAPVVLDVSRGEFQTKQLDATKTYNVGTKLYWDIANKRFTTESLGNLFAGRVTLAKDGNDVIMFALAEQRGDVGQIVEGGMVGAPTTASTHADASTYDFNANVSGLLAKIAGVVGEVAATADLDLGHGATSPIGATNTDIIYAVVVKNTSGTFALQVIAGTAAPAASAVAPLDAAITAAVTHANWVRIANVKLHRSGASAVTQTVDNTVRPVA